MKVIGIVAEYNPLHLGHAYQLSYAKHKLHADYCVIVMSGDFTQRGTPAIFDKYERTKAALSCGADMVIELPTLYATASAEWFTEGAVNVLAATGVVDTLLFGCEEPDISLIEKAADLLAEEPPSYQKTLQEGLSRGLSFAKARSRALSSFGLDGICDTPNNILAVSYVKAIKKYHLALTPQPMQRIGAGYHETAMDVPTASAAAIRSHIFAEHPEQEQAESDFLNQIPASLLPQYQALIRQNCYLSANDFSSMLKYALFLNEHFVNISDCNEDFSNKILHYRHNFTSFDSFCALLKSKNMDYARISRILNHILLRITDDDVSLLKEAPKAPYLRILGAKKESQALFTEIKKRGSAPMLTSPKNFNDCLDTAGRQMLQKDIFAADLYRAVLTEKSGLSHPTEYTRRFLLYQ